MPPVQTRYRIRVRMAARAIDEPHRTSSQLELLFDLTFVVAVAAVTAQLADHVADGRALSGIVPFLQVFFALWWAWMNFTWFASSYDTDDAPYRLLTMVQMGGALVLGGGGRVAVRDGAALLRAPRRRGTARAALVVAGIAVVCVLVTAAAIVPRRDGQERRRWNGGSGSSGRSGDAGTRS